MYRKKKRNTFSLELAGYNFSAGEIMKMLVHFSHKTGSDFFLAIVSGIFWGKSKKHIVNLSSNELANSVLRI